MRVVRMGILVAAVLALASACGDDPSVDSAAEAKFLALGDSYTIGEGVKAPERWPHQLAALLAAEGIDLGEPRIIARTGWTTDELSGAIDRQRPGTGYDLVTLLIGVNNQYRGGDIDEYRGELQALLRRAIEFARGEPKRVIVLSIPDWGATPFAVGRDRAAIAREIDAFNAVKREETAAAGARHVDVTTVSREFPGEVVGDGLHPSGQQYRRWAELALPEARAALAGQASR